MEACSGAHFLGRALRTQGHEVRLIPAQFVKPFIKSNKNDFIDAEAIAGAVDRQNMRFVPIKTDDQLDLQAMHRVPGPADDTKNFCDQPDSRLPVGARHRLCQEPDSTTGSLARGACENADENLTPRMRNLIAMLWSEWKELELQIAEMVLTGRDRIASNDAACLRLRQIPGIRTAGRNCDRSFDRQRRPPSRRVASSRPGWASVPGSTRRAARRSSMELASAGTATCAKSWCMEDTGGCLCDRNETGSPWSAWLTALEMRAPRKCVDYRYGEQAGADRLGGARDGSGLSGAVPAALAA